MFFSDVALDDYRSYRHAVIHLQPGVCVLLGANGQGKTNFVEALAYLSTFSSHRVASDNALVRFSPPAREDAPGRALIRVKMDEDGRDVLVDLEIVAGKANRARLGRTPLAPRRIIGIAKTVMFAPEDLTILRGDPGGRRRFFDDIAIQMEPVMAGVRTEHEKILRQRGALLRQASQAHKHRGHTDPLLYSTLDVWNSQLADVAARIISTRAKIMYELDQRARQAHDGVSKGARVLEMFYDASINQHIDQPLTLEQLMKPRIVHEALVQAYANVREEELRRGVNLVGAHRDDVAISLDGLPVKGYASHGETWSVALALRLAQFELVRSQGSVPVLILDDVFAELDGSRRAALLHVIDEAEQVFVTAAVASDIPEHLDAHIYRVWLGEDRTSHIAPAEDAAREDVSGGHD